MAAISIKIKQSKISNTDKLAESIEKYLVRKINYDKNKTKLTFMVGYDGNDFIDGFFRLRIS